MTAGQLVVGSRVIAHAMSPLPPLKVAESLFMIVELAVLKFQ